MKRLVFSAIVAVLLTTNFSVNAASLKDLSQVWKSPRTHSNVQLQEDLTIVYGGQDITFYKPAISQPLFAV